MSDKIKKFASAVVSINLYFMDNFKGQLIIHPLSAELSRNVAEIGEMNPFIEFKIGKNEQQSK
jgi:hypothetical protein